MTRLRRYVGPQYPKHYSFAAEIACKAVEAAEQHFAEVLLKEYPINADVRVVHHRGSFNGIVIDHRPKARYIVVRNSKTGKVSPQWFVNVERTKS